VLIGHEKMKENVNDEVEVMAVREVIVSNMTCDLKEGDNEPQTIMSDELSLKQHKGDLDDNHMSGEKGDMEISQEKVPGNRVQRKF
jgi:hypothetical protein